MDLFKSLIAYIKHIFGIWNAPTRYPQLYSTIDTIRAQRILEIGTWNGERALLMIRTAQKHHPKSDVSYYGFDLFETQPTGTRTAELSKQAPQEEIVKEKLLQTGAVVKLYKGDTHMTLPSAIQELPLMDFIFIDGGHSLDTIQNDWKFAQRLMHDKTIVIFDDYWTNRKDGGAKPIVDAIDQTQYEVRVLPVFDVFINPTYGRLVIKFAEVRKRANPAASPEKSQTSPSPQS